jgi:glucosylceramidase
MERMMRIIQTAKGDDVPWRELSPQRLRENYSFGMDSVLVDSSQTFQTHMGFGGAFTESAAYTLSHTTEENRKKVIEAYFNKDKGLAYNLGRTSINGCDFSLEPYTYVKDKDVELKTYDMSREDKWVVPFIKAASDEAGEEINIFCAPWSPPAFMKDNKDMNNGGKLLRKYYGVWAKYMVRYVKGMLDRGIHITAMSVQNEPEAKQEWASCKFNAMEEAVLAVDYIYEELKKEGLEEKIKIVILDHNKDIMLKRVQETLAYKNAEDIVWGIAYHWYGAEKSEILTVVHNKYPEKHLVFTEGCVELVNKSGDTSSDFGMGAWEHGETYGRNIINDFNNYNEAWIDWNLVLNECGGPNYVGNFCEAPILIDRTTDTIIYNKSYYYIGHFSRYIKSGAKRIKCSADAGEGIYATAYRNPNGEIVIVVQNELNIGHRLALTVDGRGTDAELLPHSITTFIISAS